MTTVVLLAVTGLGLAALYFLVASGLSLVFGLADVPALVEVIRRVVAEGGRSVLMVEHHMDVLLGLVDRLAVMHHGALLACDTPEAVMADAEVQAAYLGEPL